MEIESLEFKVKLKDGTTVLIEEPTMEDYEAFIADLNDKSKTEMGAMKNLFTKLGATDDHVKKMTLSQMRKLTKAFIEGK